MLVARLALMDASRRDDPEVEFVNAAGDELSLADVSEKHHTVVIKVSGDGFDLEPEPEIVTRTVYRSVCPEGCGE